MEPDCEANCDGMQWMKNPFAGKPAYVTASEPCAKICRPCQMQGHIAPHVLATQHASLGATIRQVTLPEEEKS